MKFTLYKNCILSNTYSEVFDCKRKVNIKNGVGTVLESYLETLSKIEIERNNVYLTEGGVISFPIELITVYKDIYEFNYMKVENSKYIRYCFITSITMGNNIVSIAYDTDIWHSYSATMKIRDSYLVNKRVNPKIPYTLPIQYYSENEVVIEELNNMQNEFYVVMQLQTYDIVSGDNITNRRTVTVGLYLYDTDTQISTIRFNRNNIYNIITTLVKNSLTKSMVFNPSVSLGERTYYEVDNITLVPFDMSSIITAGSNYFTQIKLEVDDTSDFPTYIRLQSISDTRQIFSTKLPVNFKRLSVGTVTKQIDIYNYGNEIPVSVYIHADEYNFNVILSINNAIYDITNEYVVNVPFNSVTGDVTAQREIARQFKVSNAELGIAKSAINSSLDVVSVANSALSYNATGVISSLKDFTGNITNIAGGALDIKFANKPQYITSKGSFNISSALLNATNGLISFIMNSDNDELVNDMIKNTGYNVYMFVDTSVFDEQTTYDVLKFEYIKLYGDFSQKVAGILREILQRGTKIWYTKDING